MRIRDWSSDVCSSDLKPNAIPVRKFACAKHKVRSAAGAPVERVLVVCRAEQFKDRGGAVGLAWAHIFAHILVPELMAVARTRVPAHQAHHGEDDAGNAVHDFLRRGRSEEHTSELQLLMRISYAVFCLKKK